MLRINIPFFFLDKSAKGKFFTSCSPFTINLDINIIDHKPNIWFFRKSNNYQRSIENYVHATFNFITEKTW